MAGFRDRTPRSAFQARLTAFAAVAGLALACSAVMEAKAQGTPAPPAASQPREDEAMTRARQAYEALPAADRRAIQDNLVWVGIYKGVVDGEFGRMTYNAMRGWTARSSSAGDGILGPADRAMLAAEAAKARLAVDFRHVNEPRAGFSLGIPQKVFVKRSDASAGARFETQDQSAGVETFRMREGDVTLQSLFDAYRAPAPNRRVTYSIIRPDFLVVAAETPTRATYTRVARGASGGDNLLRGFTLSWPRTQQARFEILSVAIANSFDPFGQRGAPSQPNNERPDPRSPARDGSAPNVAANAGPAPQLVATAIAFAPNRYVAVLPAGACADPRIGSRPAKLMRQDGVTGLALFDVPNGAGVRLRTPPGKAESLEAAVVIFAATSAPGAAALSAAAGEIAEIMDPGKPLRLRAAIPADSVGALALSRSGELIGLVAPVPNAQRRVPGAPPPASRDLIPAEKLGAFLSASGLEFVPPLQNAQPVSAGKLAADNKGSVDALWCGGPSAAPVALQR